MKNADAEISRSNAWTKLNASRRPNSREKPRSCASWNKRGCVRKNLQHNSKQQIPANLHPPLDLQINILLYMVSATLLTGLTVTSNMVGSVTLVIPELFRK